MGFYNIDTVYGRYVKGKWKHLLHTGLSVLDVYSCLATANCAYRRGARELHLPEQLTMADLDGANDSNFWNYHRPELHWLLSGRVEYLVTHGFFQRTGFMGMDFPAKHLIPEDQRSGTYGWTVRVVRERHFHSGGLSVGAYVTFSHVLRKNENEIGDPEDVVISVRLIETESYADTLDVPHVRPGTTFRMNWNQSFDEIVHRFIEEADDRPYNHERRVTDAAVYARLAMTIMALVRLDHRMIERQRTLAAHLTKPAKSPYAPNSYLLGRGMKPFTKEERARLDAEITANGSVFHGSVRWEQFSEVDGQFLIDWPPGSIG